MMSGMIAGVVLALLALGALVGALLMVAFGVVNRLARRVLILAAGSLACVGCLVIAAAAQSAG
jgi:hypothetical protein